MAYVNDTGYPSVTEVMAPYIDMDWFKDEHRDRGGAVHAVIEAHLKGLYVMKLKHDWQLYVDSFRRWADVAIDKVLLVEERLVDEDLGYCGQPDSVVILKGDELPCLPDWKTGQALCPTWKLQYAGYRSLVKKKKGIDVNRGLSVRLKNDGSGVILTEYSDDDYNHGFAVFLGLLNAHMYFKGGC